MKCGRLGDNVNFKERSMKRLLERRDIRKREKKKMLEILKMRRDFKL